VLARIFTMRRVTWTFLSQHAQIVDYDGHRLVLGIATVGLANTFRAGNHAELVRQALIDEIGVDVPVEGVPIADAGSDRRAAGSGSGDQRSAPPLAPEPDPWPEPDADSRTKAGAAPDFVPTAEKRSAAPPTARPTAPPNGASTTAPTAARTAAPSGDSATPNATKPAARRPGPAPTGHAASREEPDDAVSDDDESIATPSDDGRAVVERVLGGQFLGELED
jgi:DNA polymerase-3 subunit gamma/tau